MLKEARLKEVNAVLRLIESEDRKKKKTPSPKAVDRQQEDAEELERQRKWDVLSDEEKLQKFSRARLEIAPHTCFLRLKK